MTRFRLFYAAAWVGAVATGVFAGTSLATDGEAGAPPCPGAEVQAGLTAIFPANPPADHAALQFPDPEEEKVYRFGFGDSRKPIRHAIPVRVAGDQHAPTEGLNNPKGLNTRFGYPYTFTGPNGRSISAREAGVQKSLVPSTAEALDICLRLDPSQWSAKERHAGRYNGRIGLYYGDDLRTSVPVELTLRDWRWKAALIAFLGVLLGVSVKVLSEAAVVQRMKGCSAPRALWTYASQLTFPVTLILAGIAGTLAYVVLYGHDPDWGANGSDALKLFATCFVVQTSSSEVLAILSRVAGGGPPFQAVSQV